MEKEILNYIDELIIKYLSNSTSESENKNIENWISESVENKKYFENFKIIWNKTQNISEFEKFVVENSLKKVKSKINIDKKLNITKLTPYFAIAASLIILFGIYFIFKFKQNTNDSNLKNENIIIVQTLKNETKELKLSDGTIIFMNENSKLSYPKIFEKNERKINFEGEAYFQIVHNESQPFYIYTKNSITKDIGTEFNLRALSSEIQEIITVSEGIVQYSEIEKTDKSVELKIGERGIIDLENNVIEKQINSDLNYLSWKTGILTFDNEQLTNVLNVLSKHYKIKFELKNQNLKDTKLTAKYDNLTIEDIIEILKITLNVNIQNIDNKYVVSN